MSEYIVTKKIGFTDEDISDILCACIEGGSNYWAQIQNEGDKWDKAENSVSDDGTIEDIILALWNNGDSLVLRDMEGGGFHHVTLRDFLNGVQSVIDDGTWDGEDVCDVDGYVGDFIMQYATFGEVIYG